MLPAGRKVRFKIAASDPALFLAFSKDIVKELERRLPKDVHIRIINTLGHLKCKQNMARVDFDPGKYDALIRQQLTLRT